MRKTKRIKIEDIIISYDRYYKNGKYMLYEYKLNKNKRGEFKNLIKSKIKYCLYIELSIREYIDLQSCTELNNIFSFSEELIEINRETDLNINNTDLNINNIKSSKKIYMVFYIKQNIKNTDIEEMIYDEDYRNCILDRFEFYVHQEIIPIIEEFLGKEIKYKKRSDIIYTWGNK